jgi:hypothetical protein
VRQFAEGVNMSNRDLPKIVVRLPRDVKFWLIEQAAENASSQTSEIVRAVRERMLRCRSVSQDRAGATSTS